MSDDPSRAASITGLRAAGFASALLALTGVLVWGWDRGPDPLIDFGRELYVPWRLVEGDVLHRDIGWFNGPLGPWLIEGWMRLFGVSLDALQALNAVVIVVTAGLLARLVERVAGGLCAWASVVVFALVFAVAQQEASGNFLFLAPYSHGITFGFTAGLGCLVALMRAGERRSAVLFAVAGMLAGLSFLSKAEVFLALAVALVGLAVAALVSGRGQGIRLRAAGGFLLGASVPIGLAYARFASQIGADEAGFAVLGTWPHAFNEEVSRLPFYRMMRGTWDLEASLKRLALSTGAMAAVMAAIHGAVRLLAPRMPSDRLAIGGAFVGGFGALGAIGVVAPIKWMLLPLTFALPALALAAFVRACGRSSSAKALSLLALSAFAVGLLPKVLLVPLARQYGFVLSLPGTALLIALFVRWLPRRLGGGERVVRAGSAAALGVVFAFAAMNANATRNWFAGKTVPFGEGADRMWGDTWRTPVLNELCADLEERLPPGANLLVLPEGITVNYRLRRETPTRLVNFMPPELCMFDEAEIIAELEADPPAAVALIHRPTDIYGHPFFGEGYGEALLAWVQEHYVEVRQIEDEPFLPGREHFGAKVLVPRGGAR